MQIWKREFLGYEFIFQKGNVVKLEYMTLIPNFNQI